MVLKELILTATILGGCGGLERTDFSQFPLWETVVDLKELILIASILGRCGGLERTDFSQFPLWEAVVDLKELIFNHFSYGSVWWSCKN